MAEPKKLDPLNIELKGTKLIEASAGTGKTYAITSLYIRLVVEQELPVERILVVTFTEAATKELRDRVRTRLFEALTAYETETSNDLFLKDLVAKHKSAGLDLKRCQQLLSLALHSIDLASIYTIHGFCLRVLQDSSFESGTLFDLQFTEDDSDLFSLVIDDYWRNNSGEWHKVLQGYLYGRNINADSLFFELKEVVRMCRASGMNILDLPGSISPKDYQPSIEKIKSVWALSHEKIAELLTSPALSKAKTGCHPEKVNGWLAAIDDFLMADGSAVFPSEAFENLTTSSLKRNTKPSKIGETPEHEFFTICDELINELALAYNGLLLDLIQFCLKEVEKRKQAAATFSFDDLLLNVRNGLRDKELGGKLAAIVRDQYKAVLIDEFQDTDIVQYEIFHTIYGQAVNPLFLIGDPKQSIYKFRGADIFAYLQAVKSVGHQVYGMDVNWRSDPGLVNGVNLLFGSHPDNRPFYLPEISYQEVMPADKPRDVLVIENDHDTALNFILFAEQGKRDEAKRNVCEDLAGRIKGLIEAGLKGKALFTGEYRTNNGDLADSDAHRPSQNLSAGDIAVLVRNHLDGELVRTHLQERGVRAVIHSRKDVFTSLEARELQIILEGIVDPANLRFVKSALVSSLLGWKSEDIIQLEEDEAHWEDILERFSEYHKIWHKSGFAVMLFTLLRKEGVSLRLAEQKDGERRLTNLRHLMELLQGKAHAEKLGPMALLSWLKKQRHDVQEVDERQLRLESDENLVNIVTIHKCKGLEYPLVFCPFLWDSSFLRRNKKNWILWHDEKGNAHVDMGTNLWKDAELGCEREEIAEELRLLYVALTRARNRCFIYWGKVMSQSRPVTASSALNYLLHSVSDGKKSVIKGLESDFKSFSKEQMIAPIKKLAALAPDDISISFLEANVDGLLDDISKKQRLQPALEFTRNLQAGWRIQSFSSLQKHEVGDHESPDHDAILRRDTVFDGQPDDSSMNMLTFPRGAQAGSCLHDIFERVDFSNFTPETASPIIEKSLRSFGFDVSWCQAIFEGFENIINTNLEEEGTLSLAKIGLEERLNELEFYYSLPDSAENQLDDIYRGKAKNIPQNKIDPVEGDTKKSFMKGFVDLIFEWQGRYYIVDYKSNYLGAEVDDYCQENLKKEMVKAGYDLQYHIYLVALHRYLQSRIADYNYDAHMGGVYYLFIRGMMPENGSKLGVYSDLPSSEVIENIDEMLHAGCR